MIRDAFDGEIHRRTRLRESPTRIVGCVFEGSGELYAGWKDGCVFEGSGELYAGWQG